MIGKMMYTRRHFSQLVNKEALTLGKVAAPSRQLYE